MKITALCACILTLLNGVLSNAMPSKDSNPLTATENKGSHLLLSSSVKEDNDSSAITHSQFSGRNNADDDKVYIPLIREISKWPLKQWKVETETSPTFLSVIGKVFSNPRAIMAALAIPIFFIGSFIFPYIANIFASYNMLPQVTTTIASGVARSLDGRNDTVNIERVLDIINEYGARTLDDPRCIQRFLCQIAQFDIDNQTKHFWSVNEVLKNVSESIDDTTWDILGMKKVIKNIKSGKCNNLKCVGSPAYSKKNVPLIHKIVSLGSKLYKSRDMFRKM